MQSQAPQSVGYTAVTSGSVEFWRQRVSQVRPPEDAFAGTNVSSHVLCSDLLSQENRAICHRQVLHDAHRMTIMRGELDHHLMSSSGSFYSRRQPFHPGLSDTFPALSRPPTTFPSMRTQLAKFEKRTRERGGYTNYNDYRQRLPSLRLRPVTSQGPPMDCRYKNEVSGTWG